MMDSLSIYARDVLLQDAKSYHDHGDSNIPGGYAPLTYVHYLLLGFSPSYLKFVWGLAVF